MSDLSKRAVACKAWRWMPGMALETGQRVYRVDDLQGQPFIHMIPGPCPDGHMLPDLGDPATIGCLFRLAFESGASCPAWLTVEQLVEALEAAP